METETSPAAIAKRLEALSKWHEEYRILLNSKHEQQKADLEKRQNSIASSSNTMQTIEVLYKNNEQNNSLEKADISGMILFDDTIQPVSQLSPVRNTSGYVTTEEKFECSDSAQSLNPPSKMVLKTSEKHPTAPKKFLRKGEGIKQRFKIDADAFNLNKLPPYKYAKAHQKSKTKQRRQSKEKVAAPKEVEKAAPPAAKFVPMALDTHEIRFQRLLFASKTVCNSTPDSKSSTLASVAVPTKDNEHTEKLQLSANSQHTQNSQLQETCSSLGVAWSKVLDPLQIKPTDVGKLREQNDNALQKTLDDTEDDNLNLFELLEEKAKEGSFNFNCSLIKKILAKNLGTQMNAFDNETDSDIVPVSVELREAHIEPKVDEVDIASSSESEEEESEASDDEDAEGSEDEDSVAGSAEATGNEKSEATAEDEDEEHTLIDATADDKTPKPASNALRVRFIDEETNESQQESKQFEQSASLSHVDSSVLFEQMKSLVLAALAKNENPNDAAALMSTPPMNAVEIKQLAEQGRQRVAELEKQIALFKETNLQLMKAKQEHELEKVYFMQQQEEALDQINDEKIKIEIELHDERMKLEQERRKLEEKSRMQKTAIVSNERKEIAKLKEEIVMLQNKLRDKDQNHTAAQARLRSQLRVLEKEQKTLYEEIERLNREKQKLEKQLQLQTRERNSTMLSEINRNISKLAKNNLNTNENNQQGKPNAMTAKKAEEKQQIAAARRSTLKRKEQNNEPLKTLKITANSFKNLMPSIITEETTEKAQKTFPNEEDDEADDDDDDAPKQEQTLKFSPTAEKENSVEKTTSSFKVLTREITSADGGKEIIYPNGTIRKESGDGLTVRMMYFNGDVKETNVKEGTIKYYYSKTNTWHTTYLDGLEIIEFPNGQIEHRLPSGVIEVHYPHKNCIKIMDPKDPEKEAEYVYEDGTRVCEMRNGNKLLTLPNGQKELTTKEFKRREYPDGTIKTVYPDGSHETRYSNGRLRLKDKDGNLIIDSELQPPNSMQQQHQQQLQRQQSVAGFN